MAVHSNCPKCQKQVLVPEGAGDCVVRCPLCHEEYELREAHALLAPALIIVKHGSAALSASWPAIGMAVEDPSAGSLLQAREHVVPVTLAHDSADEFNFSEEPLSPFHTESIAGAPPSAEAVRFEPATLADGDIVAFEPEQSFGEEHAFETIADVQLADAPDHLGSGGHQDPEGQPSSAHDDNPFAEEHIGQHPYAEAAHDHDGHGVTTLGEPEMVEADASAPWNSSRWHEGGAESHEHGHRHDEIAVVEDDGMSAVDFAAMTGKAPAATEEADGATVKKKKRRRESSGGGIGRFVGVVVSGLLALPCVVVLGAIVGDRTDVMTLRPWMKNIPYVNMLVGGPPAAAKPRANIAANNGGRSPSPGNQNVGVPANSKPSSSSMPNQSSAGKPEDSRPNKPYSPDKPEAAAGKTKETKPQEQLADAGIAKKPSDKSADKPAEKPAGKPAENGKSEPDDPFAEPTPIAPGAKSNAKPDAKPGSRTEADDPFSEPVKPDANLPSPDIKPVAPAKSSNDPKLDETPAVPNTKPVGKTDAKPGDNSSAKPIDGGKEVDDPFSEPNSKPDITPDAKPDEVKPALDVPAKPNLKTEVEPNHPDIHSKPEIPTKPEPKPIVEPVVAAVGPKQSPAFEAKAVSQALTRMTLPADLDPAAYGDLCNLAEMTTYVKAGGETEKKSFAALLSKLAADPQLAGKMTSMGKARLDDPAAGGGVVLSGKVLVSLKKGDLYGTAIEVPAHGNVMVFSSHALDVNKDDNVLVPGAIVRDPAKNLPGYPGKQPVVVWADFTVKLP